MASLPPLPEQDLTDKSPTLSIPPAPPIVLPVGKKPEKVYFYCSWPDLHVAKPEKPEVQFKGRLLVTEDAALVDWVRFIAVKAPAGMYQINELSAEVYDKYLTGELG